MANDLPKYDPGDEGYGDYTEGKKDFYTIKVPKPKYAYPSSLLTESMKTIPFIHLNVVDSNVQKRSRFAVALPFPTSVKVSYNANWDTIDVGAFGGAMMEAFRSSKEPIYGKDGVNWTEVGRISKESAGGAATSMVQNAGAMIDEVTGLNAFAAAQIAKRFQVNPHAALRFMGMAFREFVLDFVLLPKNQEDSKQINDVIFQLKYAMHPEGSTLGGAAGQGAALSSYFSYPNEFIIGFYAPNLKNLFRTSPCELLSCAVEYNGSGVPAFFRDDKPVCILLSLHFKESEILTKQRIRMGW